MKENRNPDNGASVGGLYFYKCCVIRKGKKAIDAIIFYF